MPKPIDNAGFPVINHGYDAVFRLNRLSVGLVVPLECYADDAVPTMIDQVARIQWAESLGFSAVWLRDVPFNVPSFGDTGQVYDPFVYLGLLAAQTTRIALGVASIVLPLRHPAHVAKAAASIDVLSGGRLLLGIASGDRPEEYPALDRSFPERGCSFRESVAYIQRMWEHSPAFDNRHGRLEGGMDLLPKPASGRLPLIVTGGSQQTPEWIAAHGDGWMLYPRPVETQAQIIGDWRARTRSAGRGERPVMQPLYVDLMSDPEAPPQSIHLGLRLGVRALRRHLEALEAIGVNHVALNLRFNQADIDDTLNRLADDILPAFSLPE